MYIPVLLRRNKAFADDYQRQSGTRLLSIVIFNKWRAALRLISRTHRQLGLASSLRSYPTS